MNGDSIGKSILVGLFVTVVGGVLLHFLIKTISPTKDEEIVVVTPKETSPQKEQDETLKREIVKRKVTEKEIIVSEGLIGYYKLNGNTNDHVGISTPGRNFNVIWTKNRFGLEDHAAAFVGNAYIQLSTRFPLKSYTKTAWVQRGVSNSSGWIGNNILSGDNGQDPKRNLEAHKGHALWIPSANYYKLSAGHNNDWKLVSSKESIKTKEWIFAAVTYEFASYELKLFLNGKLVSENKSVPPIPECPDLYIGSHSKGNFFHGFIDDVRIYNRALSDEEINMIYTKEKVEEN